MIGMNQTDWEGKSNVITLMDGTRQAKFAPGKVRGENDEQPIWWAGSS